MGFFSSILGAAAPIVGGIFGGPAGAALGGLLGGAASGGSQQSGNTTSTQKTEIDPRMQAYLYGDGSAASAGLLGQAAGLANKPQSAGLTGFGNGMDQYLQNYNGMTGMQGAANSLMAGNGTAPNASAATSAGPSPMQAANAGGVSVGAPNQNGTDLTKAYNDTIYGNAAENPYLTGAIQKGINQSSAAFQNLQADATKNLTESVLPQIRSNSIMNGTYGGSRQGLAEGKAVGQFSTDMSRALSQVGQNNTDAAVVAQAGAFSQGQDRSLSAMSGLGAQQYGVAGQNAGLQQQTNLSNAGFQQGANSQNNQQSQQTNLANAGWQQQANLANQSAQLNTNQLNSANMATGLSANQGLLGSAYNYAKANDQYGGQQVGQATGLLAPFTGLGGSQTSSQPYYTNTAGNMLGGATGALGLYNSYKQATGGTNSGQLTNPGQAPANYDWGSMLSGFGG